MPPKRRGTQTDADMPPPKRSTPGAATPQSMDSDDDYDDDVMGRALDNATRYFSNAQPRKSKGKDGKTPRFDINAGAEMPLKPDHKNRPMFIDPQTSHIILESFHPLASYASDFLTSIAEPLSRPTHIHEYALTANSLFTASSIGLNADVICNGLNRFLKTALPAATVNFIQRCTEKYGKARLVLKGNEYYLETTDAAFLHSFLNDEQISKMGLLTENITTEAAPLAAAAAVIPGTSDAAGVKQVSGSLKESHQDDQGPPGSPNSVTSDQSRQEERERAQLMEALRAEEDEIDDDDQAPIHSLHIPKHKVEALAQRALSQNMPLVEEYDYNNDNLNAKLDIDLRAGTKIRDYQEKGLGKMFGNGRARSGIIVLPCGAGKTLVGVTAACTLRRSVIILCNSEMSCIQWRAEFLKWSNISRDDISLFTSSSKQRFPHAAGIMICTYQIMGYSGKRAHDSQRLYGWLTDREWGLMILDEVHIAPAQVFRRIGEHISAHCKLGLTATLLREDDKIGDLAFLVGPKLYEANWMELSNQGHIARVQCAEVWCPMTAEFYKEYLEVKSKKRGLLYIMNPTKVQACQFLITHHEARGDKILVFSDNVYALEHYALKINRPFLQGSTSPQERQHVLDNFQNNPDIKTLFLSKIGDTSLDLPEATVLIQISSHYSSRRQEAQRLGRILRAKRRNDEGFNAFFYSLVSKDTDEMRYSSKRQAFLVDQGYAFKVINHLSGIQDMPGLAYKTKSEQRELLQDVLIQNEDKADFGNDEGNAYAQAERRNKKGKGKSVRRQAGELADFAGGKDMAYIEYNKSKNKQLKAKKGRSLAEQMASQKMREKKARAEMFAK